MLAKPWRVALTNIFWRLQMKDMHLLLSQYQSSAFIYSREWARSNRALCKEIPLAANAFDFTILYKIIVGLFFSFKKQEAKGIKTIMIKPRSDIFCQIEKNRILTALERMPRNYLYNCKEHRLWYKKLVHVTVIFNCAIITIFYSRPQLSHSSWKQHQIAYCYLSPNKGGEVPSCQVPKTTTCIFF